ncbi:peptidoglycan-binding protein [Streptomyces sp. B3I8]|uniref:peptidoglycan-binding protein n=1 Tax=Streptomyces sp. B3I8 TaxID=3042303 RepID=UPI002781BCC7|nr:peptidoglycan-binding protein [Streptomyces sp. B3I8]MDQ0785119.1 transcriptional regulator with XRE-family HTH domain [Streptomyces sp. B3I8]
MSRWKPLSADLDPPVRQLVICLRRLKDRTGLSLARLAEQTGYSAKSWERYLGGRTLPPLEAVQALARLADTDPTPLLALHEVVTAGRATARATGRTGRSAPNGRAPRAETETGPGVWQPEAAPEPGVEPAASAQGPPRAPGRALRVALVASAVAAVLALSSAALLAVRLHGGDDGPAAGPAVPPAVAAAASAPAEARSYGCHVHRTDGRWYAGNSRTRRTEVAYGSVGPDVAEAQCLLRRAGISPGGIDGIFGPLTRWAVRDFQKRSRLAVDGRVGPHTWKALRG